MLDNMQERILSGFAWQSLTKFFVQTFSWVSTILVVRILSPADYGIVALSGLFTGLLMVIAEVGLGQGLIQKKQVSVETEDGIFVFSMLLGILTYALLYQLAPYIAEYYEVDILTDMLRLGGLGLILTVIRTVPFSRCMREMDFRYRSIVELVRNFLGMLTVLILAYSGYGVWSLMWGFVINRIADATLFLVKFDRLPRLKFNWTEISSVLEFGYKLMFATIMNFFSGKADAFFIARYLSESILGYYSMAMQLATMPLDKIGSIFTQVAFPAFSRMQDDLPTSRKFYLDTHKYLLAITYPMFAGLALIAEDLIVLVMTDKWSFSTPILQILCVINLLRISVILISPVLLARGHAGKILIFTTISTLSLSFGFFVGAQYSIHHVLLAWLVIYPLLYLGITIVCLNELEVKLGEYLGSMKSACIATLLMVLTIHSFREAVALEAGLIRLTADILVGGLSYTAVYFLLFKGEIEEIKYGLRKLFRKES
ncbi:MAG: oligosaccharide flippase family protein [Gammaproteobacteria bacterium]|nr:oligosaccharide flippase family protein [Gammaproteobacteria bacterium]